MVLSCRTFRHSEIIGGQQNPRDRVCAHGPATVTAMTDQCLLWLSDDDVPDGTATTSAIRFSVRGIHGHRTDTRRQSSFDA